LRTGNAEDALWIIERGHDGRHAAPATLANAEAPEVRTVMAVADPTADGAQRIIVWSLVFVGLLIAAFVVIARVRRRLNKPEDRALSGGTGFTLSDLRQMHKSGQMTDAEFERAKAKIVAAVKRTNERDRSETAPLRQARRMPEVETKPARSDNDDRPKAD
jgi:hypothetical protein